MSGRTVARVERARRDAAILESIARGATLQAAADEHAVSKTTAHRVLSNMRETLPEQSVARDMMMSRFATYRARLWPVLDQDPVKGVRALLDVDTLEARTRGLFDHHGENGTAEVSGMLALLIGRSKGGEA